MRAELHKYNVWLIDSPEHKNLLSLALHARNARRTAILVLFDSSRPWLIPSQLEQWKKALEELVNPLVENGLSENVQEEMRQRGAVFFVGGGVTSCACLWPFHLSHVVC